MKIHTSIAVAGISSFLLVRTALADDCNISNFVQSINQEWVARDYAAIGQLIDTRLSTCTNDLMGLMMKYQYYYWATVNFSNAQAAARTFVAAASNRAPNEVNQPGIVMQEVKAMAQMTTPSSFPTNQARTADQIEYLHTREFPTNFPRIFLDEDLVNRVMQSP